MQITRATWARALVTGLVAGAMFLLFAHHFLSPPDCAFYWAWAEAPLRTGSFDFQPVYGKLNMPTFYVWLTPAGHLSNDWPIGAGAVLAPAVLPGPAAAHAWMMLWVAAALLLWWRSAPFAGAARTVALLGAVIGTPLLFYTLYGPFFSHPASFAAVTAFLVLWERTRSARSASEYLLLGLLLGFATLIRPQNALLGVVLLLEVPRQLTTRSIARQAVFSWLVLVAGAGLAFSPQVIAWWSLYGSPLALPKVEEMRWFSPNVSELLFSDFHGLLPWTPVYMVAAIGLMALARRDAILAGALAMVLLLQIYVNAANEVWWSGGSFGNRRLSDYAVVVAYGLAALWNPQTTASLPGASEASRTYRILLAITIALCCTWTLTLLLAERRELVPLDRYVPFKTAEFRQALFNVWTDPGKTATALLKPLVEAWNSGVFVQRLIAAACLAVGSAATASLIFRARRSSVRPLAAIAGSVAAALVVATTYAGTNTPVVTDPELRKILRRSPGILWDNYLELALYELVKGRPAKSEEAARKAVSIRPDHYSGYWYLAQALQDQRRYGEAIESYNALLRLNPGHARATAAREHLWALQGMP